MPIDPTRAILAPQPVDAPNAPDKRTEPPSEDFAKVLKAEAKARKAAAEPHDPAQPQAPGADGTHEIATVNPDGTVQAPPADGSATPADAEDGTTAPTDPAAPTAPAAPPPPPPADGTTPPPTGEGETGAGTTPVPGAGDGTTPAPGTTVPADGTEGPPATDGTEPGAEVPETGAQPGMGDPDGGDALPEPATGDDALVGLMPSLPGMPPVPADAAEATLPVPAGPADGTELAPVIAPGGPVPAGGSLLAGTPLQRAVTLEQAPRAVANLIHISQQKEVSRARMVLRPAELGGIEVSLQANPQGVTARIVADSPQAAQLLRQATEDLRRTLRDQDVTLISVDVSTSDERREAEAGGARRWDLDGSDGGGPGRRGGLGQGDSPLDLEPPTRETVLALPDGLLVDVLA